MAHTNGGSSLDPEGQVTIAMLAAEPLLRGCMVAGMAGLHRAASWCLPLSEVWDPQGGGAAASGQAGRATDLTADLTGVVVHLPATALTGPKDARALVTQLARRGVTALLAWPPPGTTADLTAAAQSADEAGVPLFALRGEADYRAVSRFVGQKVLSQTTHVLEYGMRVHRTLARTLAYGSGVPAMARAIARLSRSPILVLEADGEVSTHAGFKAGGPQPGEVAALLMEQLAGLPPEVWVADRRPAELELRPASGPAQVLMAPVVIGDELFGRLVLVEPAWPPDAHDLAQHRVIVEHGAPLTGSEMLRERSIRAAEERARGDFAEALVHGRFADPHELAARSRHHGFDVAARYAVLVVTAAALGPAHGHGQRRTAALRAQSVDAGAEVWTLAAPVATMIVVIRQLPAGLADEERAVAGFARHLLDALGPRLGEDTRVTYGRPGQGARGVAASYYEARMAMELAGATGRAPVCGYHELRVFAALKGVAASPEGQAFAREVLEALRQVASHSGDLEQVVLAYVQAAGNLNAAARALKLHRNTMLYKLDRASRALRMDIRSADAQFMVWLAHHIDRLTSATTTLAAELSPPGDDTPPGNGTPQG